MKNILTISLILVIAILIRLVGLPQFPPSLNWDETSLGYNAFSILKTGHDEWGVVFPIIFRAFGDYKLPGYIYFSVLPTFLFGLNPISTRLTSAIFGTILIISTFIITKKITGHGKLYTGYYAAILTAVLPWTWFLSRIALEANVAVSVFSLGMALYLSNFSSIITTLFLTLPVWIYNSYRVFIPLILIPLFLLNRKKISIVTALIVLLPMLYQMFFTAGQARYKWVSIIDSGAIGQLNELRNNSGFKYKKLIYNRYTYFIYQFSKNYLNHFSPKFLFTSGSSNYQFNVPGHGLIYLFLAPFLYWGIYEIFKTRNYLLIFWLLLAPIASSITKDSPHVLRSITFLPLPFILISRQLSQIRSKILLIIILLVFLGSGILYFASLNDYRIKYSWSWQYGMPQLVSYIHQHQNQYDEIFITKKYGEPHIFFLYYQKLNPGSYLTDSNLHRYFKSDWYWVDSFSKYQFINDWEFLEKTKNLDPDKKYLLISSSPIPATLLTDIKFLDGKTAFYIYEK